MNPIELLTKVFLVWWGAACVVVAVRMILDMLRGVRR